MVGKKDAWDKIFAHYNLLEELSTNNFFDISAKELKEVGGEEPRILTKIDCYEDLPPIMQAHDFAILAIRNGTYRIAAVNPFIQIQEDIETEIIEIDPPKDLICLDPFDVRGESAALDLSAASKIHDQVFGGPSKLVIRGRRFANLSFDLGNIKYDIEGVQIEVDGGYETNDSINLVEAKIGYRSNLSIRQLLYPQLYWQDQVNGRKQVNSFIFYLHGDVFRYIPYIYRGNKGYADHSQEKAFRFKLPSSGFKLTDIKTSPCLVRTDCPFPQADRFDRVDNMLIYAIGKAHISKDTLDSLFNINPRQVDYYTNVLKWMGLADGGSVFGLTEKGNEIAQLPFHKRMQEMSKIVFSEPIFNKRLRGEPIDDKDYEIYSIPSTSTRDRRMKTVDAWIKYFRETLEP